MIVGNGMNEYIDEEMRMKCYGQARRVFCLLLGCYLVDGKPRLQVDNVVVMF
jgi:hypothetical protein